MTAGLDAVSRTVFAEQVAAPPSIELAAPPAAPAPPMVPSRAASSELPEPSAEAELVALRPQPVAPRSSRPGRVRPPAPAPAEPPAHSPQAPGSAAAAHELAAEVAALGAAKSALNRGSATEALAAVAAYRERFPRGHLASEAAVIEMDARLVAGDRDGAQRIAEGLADAPTPSGARARKTLHEIAKGDER